jgi:hypothetical protein
MTSSLYDQCVCGHMHPEHTAWGRCRGCITCLTDDRSDHPYNPCTCRSFTFESRRFEPLGTDDLGASHHSPE